MLTGGAGRERRILVSCVFEEAARDKEDRQASFGAGAALFSIVGRSRQRPTPEKRRAQNKPAQMGG